MIKSYTDLSQSKKLAEILPLESADMFMFNNVGESGKVDGTNTSVIFKEYFNPLAEAPEILPCWSLAALLDVLPKEINIEEQRYAPCLFPVQDKWLLKLWYNSNYIITSPIAIFSDNPVDACVAMIEKLHELNLL